MLFFIDGKFAAGKDAQPHMNEERERVRELKAAGTLIWAYRRPEIGGGVVMLVDAEDRQEVEQTLETLPFVRLGIMPCQIEAVESLEFIWSAESA